MDYTDPTDTVAPAETAALTGDLGVLVARVKQRVAPDSTFELEGLGEGYVASFRTNIDGEREFQRWMKWATHQGDLNAVRFSGRVLAETNTRIVHDGKPMLGGDGEPLTFRSRELLDALEVSTAVDCARRCVGLDGQVIALGDGVLDRAGFGRGAVQATDPTVSASQSS